MRISLDQNKLADARSIAEKLSELPKDALLYIAGYVDAYRDISKKKKEDRGD